MKRLFDSTGNIIEIFHDDEGDKCWIETRQDVEPIIEANKSLHNAGLSAVKNDFWELAAVIPNTVYLKWLIEDGLKPSQLHGEEMTKYLKKKLNDPANRWMKTQDSRF